MKIEIVREEVEVAVIVFESVVVAASVLVSDAIEARRFGHRQGSQEDAVDQGEDRGVRADSEGESKYRREGETGGVAELSEGITDVLRQHLQKRQSALGPVGFFGLGDTTKVAERRSFAPLAATSRA